MDLAHAGMRLMRLNCRGRTGILPILPEGTVIPKIIHQIFLSDPRNRYLRNWLII